MASPYDALQRCFVTTDAQHRQQNAAARAVAGAEVQSDIADLSGGHGPAAHACHIHSRDLPQVCLRSVLAISLPAIFEQLIQAAIGLTDALVAGHLPGDERTVAAASAAVGVMAYLQWMAAILNVAFGVGATAIVARSIGARRPRVANRVAGTAISSALLVGIAVAILMFTFARGISSAAGLDGLALTYGERYLRIMTLTIALQAAWQIGMACIRGAGDTVRPMLITAAVVIINVLTSTIFSFGLLGAPKMGIRGIALGTAMAFLIGGIATMVLLLGGRSRLKLQWRHFRIVPHILVRLVRIGLPSWLEGVFLWVGQFLIVIFVITVNDKAVGVSGATMAAHNTVLRIESLAFLPGFGFGIACSALVGQYLGARRPLEAREAARMCSRLTIITMTLLALPMIFFPHFLLGTMVDADAVVRVGVWPMILAGLAQPGFACAIVYGSALRGAGDTIRPMMCTISGTFLVRIPIVILMLWIFHRMNHPAWGLIAAWIGIFIDLNYRGLINYLNFRGGKWMLKKV